MAESFSLLATLRTRFFYFKQGSGLLRGGGLGGFVQAKMVGTSSSPFFLPPTKCLLHTREFVFTGVFCRLIFANHFFNKAG